MTKVSHTLLVLCEARNINNAVKRLVKEFTDPLSKRNAWARSVPDSKRSKSYPVPETAYDINAGNCEEFAEALMELVPGGEVVDLGHLMINDERFLPPGFDSLSDDEQQKWIDMQDLPAHYAYLYGGKYYDSQHPNGVDDWTELDLIKGVSREEFLSRG